MSDIAAEPKRGTKIYEDVARELRGLIVSGQLAPGERLQPEVALAEQFGVSRATIREALRLCAGQDLIWTAEGSTGGSFVARADSGRISESLRSGLDLLMVAQEISLDELFEMRVLLELPAARLAAHRRTDEELQRLADSSPVELLELSPDDQFSYNEEFHSILIEASNNVLLSIAARPVFIVLQRNLVRSGLDPRFHRMINQHHHQIAAAVEEGDAVAAENRMLEHLEFLRPYYERAWRNAQKA
jgi:GntR family transcriptional repressor for pyruvate dehydrogenase complex